MSSQSWEKVGSNQIRNCCLHIFFFRSYTNLNFMFHLISLSTKFYNRGFVVCTLFIFLSFCMPLVFFFELQYLVSGFFFYINATKMLSLFDIFSMVILQVWDIQPLSCVWSSGRNIFSPHFWKLCLLCFLVHKSEDWTLMDNYFCNKQNFSLYFYH